MVCKHACCGYRSCLCGKVFGEVSEEDGVKVSEYESESWFEVSGWVLALSILGLMSLVRMVCVTWIFRFLISKLMSRQPFRVPKSVAPVLRWNTNSARKMKATVETTPVYVGAQEDSIQSSSSMRKE